MKFEKCYCGNTDYSVFRDFGERKVIECTSCGLFRSFPLPVKSVCDDNYQEINDTQKLHHHQLFVLNRVMKLAENYGSEILDVGCSSGNMLDYLKDRGYINLYGVEMNEYAVKLARAKLLNVRKMDTGNLDLKETFEVIYLNHVLEHIPDLNVFIDKIKLHLKSGAYLIIAVPNIGGRNTGGKDWIGYQFEQHYWHFTPESLAKIFLKCGFSVHEKYTLSGGRIKSAFYRTFNIRGDSLISVFKYGG